MKIQHVFHIANSHRKIKIKSVINMNRVAKYKGVAHKPMLLKP